MTLVGPKSVGWKTNSEINNTSKYVIKKKYIKVQFAQYYLA